MRSHLADILMIFAILATKCTGRRPDYTKTIQPYTYTNVGTWGFVDWCPAGTYAYAFSLKFEEPQGKFGDDSTLNAVKLDCRYGMILNEFHKYCIVF